MTTINTDYTANMEEVNLHKPSVTKVKINRPKRQKTIAQLNTKITDKLPENETDKNIDVDINVESMESVDKFIKNCDWGDFDLALLVNTLEKLSTVITGIDLFPYQRALQRRVFWSILLNDSAIITGLISRQGGKSQTLACTITTLCVVMPSLAKLYPDQLGVYEKGFWVGIYAPVMEQAETIYAKVLSTAKSTHAQEVYKDPGINTKMELHGCRWSNGSHVHRQSASPKAQTESKTWHLLLLEEAQGLAEEVIDQKLLPMVAWTAGTTVMIGTVEQERVPFYLQIEQNRDADTLRPPHLKCHIEFDYIEVMKYNSRYAKHVDSVVKKYGKDSVYFKMSYGLEWQFGETHPITMETLINYCYSPKVGITAYSDDPVVVSIDLAKEGDLTVTTVIKIPRIYMEYEDGLFEYVKAIQILNWFSVGNMKYTQQRPMIHDFLSAYPNIVAIVVDTTGVGTSVYEEMQREWNYLCDWTPFVFSPKSKQEMTKLWEEYLYSNRLIIPSDQQAKDTKHQKMLMSQATKQKKITKQNYTYYTSMTEQVHDDYFWSWLLGVWGAHKLIAAGMEVECNPGAIYRPNNYPEFTGLQNRREQVKAGEYLKLDIRQQRLSKWGK